MRVQTPWNMLEASAVMPKQSLSEGQAQGQGTQNVRNGYRQ